MNVPDDSQAKARTATQTRSASSARRTLSGLRVVSVLTVLSRVTGLMRDSAMAVLFGNNMFLDTFSLAFRVPNMARRLFGEGAMTTAFLPAFVRVETRDGLGTASALLLRVVRRLTTILSVILVLMATALLAVKWFWQPLSDRSLLLVDLSLILLPYMILICVAAVFAASLNGLNRFAVPAAIPITLNVVWIAGLVVIAANWHSDQERILPIAFVVVLGGVAQLAMSVLGARTAGVELRPQLKEVQSAAVARESAEVFGTMLPVLAGLSVMQLNSVLDSVMAWLLSSNTAASLEMFDGRVSFHLPEGTTAALYFGQRVFQFPIGVFGVALGTVLFPQFARHAAKGDQNALRDDLAYGIRLVLMVGLPSSAGLWIVSLPTSDILFRYGSFNAEDAVQTAQMIAAYGTGVVTTSLLLIVIRVFYACGDQKTPLRHGLISVAANIVFNILLIPVLGAPGLAIASVLAGTIQLVLTSAAMHRERCRLPRRDLLSFAVRCLVATTVMTVVGFGVLSLIPVRSESILLRLVRFGTPIVSCSATYGFVLWLLGVNPRRVLTERSGD